MSKNKTSNDKDVFAPKLNPHKLLKRDMLWLWTNRCKEHGRLYTEHPACFFKDKPVINPPFTEKVGFFDIEATNFKANFGYMFCYCIKELDGELISRTVTPKDIHDGVFDRNLCIQLCKDLLKFDRIVVYWGKDYRFDVPFVRTRTVFWEQRALKEKKKALAKELFFPDYMELFVEDLFDTVKSKFRLHRNSLATFCDLFGIECKTHPMEFWYWNRAQSGHQPSLDYILEHCKEDAISTQDAWKVAYRFKRQTKTSI